MSLLKAIRAQLGLSVTPANNFSFDASADNGTMLLERGNGQDIMTVDAAGKVSFPQGTIPNQSMVRLNTVNGYGSVNTKIRRFTNIVTNQGSDITYADSVTLGATFTINSSGVYSVNYSDQFNTANDAACITLNDSVPTGGATVSDLLACGGETAANIPACCSWSGYLVAGSVIRARSYAGSATGAAIMFGQFTIARIA